VEEISLVDSKETHQIKSPSTEASTINPEVEIPEVKLYDLRGENFQNTPFSFVEIYTSEVKEVSLVYNIVYT
jgi:hypothetical protein